MNAKSRIVDGLYVKEYFSDQIFKRNLLIDRDGTLVHDDGYVHLLNELHVFEDAISNLKSLANSEVGIHVITNQSGVGRGLFSVEDMERFNDALVELLHKNGIKIQTLVACIHNPEDTPKCQCRKPQSGMIDYLIEKKKIEKAHSFIIGDKSSDLEAGVNAKIPGFLLETPNQWKAAIKTFKRYICL